MTRDSTVPEGAATRPEGDSASGSAGVRPRKRLSRQAKGMIALGSTLVGLVVVALVAITAFAGSLAHSFDSNTTKIADAFPSESTRPAATADGAVNILLLGSDSRADATTVDDPSATDQRTDSMMLVHVSGDRKSVTTMSIMRDLYVPIPGHGSNKINAAFAYGGSPLTVQTVEQLLGTRIDHVAIIDFEGFKAMSTALGGVDVDSSRAFAANGFTFTKGINHLQGDAALAFVRERHAFADADYTRVKNQQAFVDAIAGAVLSRGTLTDPARLSAFVDATTKHLAVDKAFTASTLVDLGFGLRGLDKSGIRSFTIPTAGTGTVGGQSIVKVDDAAMPGLRAAFANDTVADRISK